MAKRPQTPNDPLIGKQLGDYRIDRRIAAGGMAMIYAGYDAQLDRTAAVKVLAMDDANQDPSLMSRFRLEARAIARLHHPNIVGVYQFGENAGLYYIAMEFIEGSDLAEELKRMRRTKQKVGVERALWILDQIASALDYAHDQNIIHRDVKPSNILLPQNRAVLTDFGLVLFQTQQSTMGTAFGTPRYISPEQAIDSSRAVPQSDIYSLAVVFYEILVGESPFDGDSPMEMALKHISEPPPSPRLRNKDIPPAVDAALLKALEKQPEKRFNTATEFIQAIRVGYGLASAAVPEISQPVMSPSSLSSVSKSRSSATPPVRKAAPPAPQSAQPGMSIFVSYSSKNRDERTNVVEQLGKLNKTIKDVWFDDGLKQHGGQEWWDKILEQVRSRDLFVFVLTPESLLSFACYLEYTYAHALNKWILPVKSQPFEIPLLPPALKGTQIVDFTGDDRVAQLKGSVEDIVGQRPKMPPLELPAPPPVPYDDFAPAARPLLNATEQIPTHDQHALYSMLESLLQEVRTREGAMILLNILQSRGDTVHQVGRKVEKLLESINRPGLMNRFFGRKGR